MSRKQHEDGMTDALTEHLDADHGIIVPEKTTPRVRFSYRQPYDIDRDDLERALTDITPDEESLTQQHFKDETDLNVILPRMGFTDGSQLPAAMSPDYYNGEIVDITDMQRMADEGLGAIMRQQRDAVERFMQLPAKIRAQFENNPAKLHQWVSDPRNADEAVEMGLLHRSHGDEEARNKAKAEGTAPPAPPSNP